VRALGFDPDVNRSAMIPLGSRNGEVEFAWPQAVVDALVSGTTPGRALQGEYIPNRDAAEFATNIVGGGGFLSGMTKPVKGALGANMWHGGPNRWAPEPGRPEGRPRLDKIGTGDGAQAYGHGFYSAEGKGVGETYQRVIGGDGGWATNTNPAFAQLGQSEVTKLPDAIAGRLNAAWHNRGPDAAKAMARKSFEESRGTPYSDTLHKLAFDADWSPKGTLYKLDLPDADVAKYLDWDAPLSEQPKNIQAAIEGLAREYGGGDMDKMFSAAGPLREGVTAESFYRTLAKETGSQAAASEALRKAGIPGLKYYDQMSRGLTGFGGQQGYKIVLPDGTDVGGRATASGAGLNQKQAEIALQNLRSQHPDARIEKLEGTRNYVTWDQDVLDRAKILERNNEILANQLKNKGLLMGGNPLAAPLLMPSKTDPLSDPQWAAEFLKSGGA
jgi:hypothetical protein